MKTSLLVHLARLLVLSWLVQAAPAFAFELGAGFAAVEEGDDRVRPGMSLHVGVNEFYASRLYYYGREFGPVREETYIASFVRRWGVFKSNAVTANFGFALMDERTQLEFEGTDASENDSEDNYNVGAAMGIAWSLPKGTGPLYASVSWDSHVFLAGTGGLLLSTGRKQTISLILGMAIR